MAGQCQARKAESQHDSPPDGPAKSLDLKVRTQAANHLGSTKLELRERTRLLPQIKKTKKTIKRLDARLDYVRKRLASWASFAFVTPKSWLYFMLGCPLERV